MIRNTLRSILAAAALVALSFGLLTLVSTNVRAGDNPCDPTFGIIKACRDHHGRWDSSCCCCRLH